MLDSVLSARSRFLAPKGLMVPSQCSILLALYDASDMIRDRVEFWDDVYGFKMASMKEGWSDDGVIDTVAGSGVRSVECVLKVSDCLTHVCYILERENRSGVSLVIGRAYPNGDRTRIVLPNSIRTCCRLAEHYPRLPR